MMGEQGGLGLLQMGVGGNHHVGTQPGGSIHQHQRQAGQAFGMSGNPPPHVENEVQRHLVVAGPAGVEHSSHRSNQLDQATLHSRVHILVSLQEDEPWARALSAMACNPSDAVGPL